MSSNTQLLLSQTAGNGPGGSSSLNAPQSDGPGPGALALQIALPVDMVVRQQNPKVVRVPSRSDRSG